MAESTLVALATAVGGIMGLIATIWIFRLNFERGRHQPQSKHSRTRAREVTQAPRDKSDQKYNVVLSTVLAFVSIALALVSVLPRILQLLRKLL